MTRDPRLTPARADVAAEHLRDEVEADRFEEGSHYRVQAELAPMRSRPDGAASFSTVLLHGEEITVYDETDGWAWGQSALDGYVGYLPSKALTPATDPTPTHRVVSLTTQIYPRPELKLPPGSRLSFGARVAVADTSGGHARVDSDGWVPRPHLRALDDPEPDWVAVAERFTGVPYLWGGRSAEGLDCSALVQLARQAAGHDCPRDSDMQEAALGTTLADDAPLRRGDLVFWRGHVGVMTSPKLLLHANAHHMMVVEEPLQSTMSRIEAAGEGAITRRARLDVDAAEE